VTDFYGGLDQLWASIHIAGGFAFAPIAKSDKALLLVSSTPICIAYLCSRAAVAAFERAGAGGRIVNVAARHALEPRLGATSRPMRSQRPASRHLQWRSARRSRRTMFW